MMVDVILHLFGGKMVYSARNPGAQILIAVRNGLSAEQFEEDHVLRHHLTTVLLFNKIHNVPGLQYQLAGFKEV
jgi:hypothetical protein